MNRVRWCLESGVNNSHLHQASWFDRLKYAKHAASELPEAPDGKPRPYRITRYEYADVITGWERLVDVRVVAERLRRERC